MRLDYIADAPLGDCYAAPFRREVLEYHRNRYMGDEAARLNVWLDGVKEPISAAQVYYRGRSVLPEYLRGSAAAITAAAAGYVSHRIFFSGFSEGEAKTAPGKRMMAELAKSFGSADRFYYIFRRMAESFIGSGFIWLARERKKHRGGGALKLIPTPCGVLPGEALKPLIALDMWEHAFTGEFTRRADYAAAYLAALDWQKFEGN